MTAVSSPSVPANGDGTKRPGVLFRVLVAGVMATVFVGCTAVFAWFVIPRFTAIFADFDTELPWITVALIQHGNWALPLSGVWLGLILVGHAAISVFIPKLINVLIRVGILGLMGLLILFMIYSLLLPMVQLMGSVT